MQDFTPNPPRLRRGMIVCMTGAHPGLTRDSLVAATEKHGVEWKKSMSALVDVLVSADPTSQSGKARKARALGRPIASYDWLLNGLNDLQCRDRSRETHEVRMSQLPAQAPALESQRS